MMSGVFSCLGRGRRSHAQKDVDVDAESPESCASCASSRVEREHRSPGRAVEADSQDSCLAYSFESGKSQSCAGLVILISGTSCSTFKAMLIFHNELAGFWIYAPYVPYGKA
mmetsp:Transcript_64959/g.152848  ORF Transcript_64959/g.152848 Transcript_64959/m.152848 type:complete len:112 (+) Transcript_64959:268-603(+)